MHTKQKECVLKHINQAISTLVCRVLSQYTGEYNNVQFEGDSPNIDYNDEIYEKAVENWNALNLVQLQQYNDPTNYPKALQMLKDLLPEVLKEKP